MRGGAPPIVSDMSVSTAISSPGAPEAGVVLTARILNLSTNDCGVKFGVHDAAQRLARSITLKAVRLACVAFTS